MPRAMLRLRRTTLLLAALAGLTAAAPARAQDPTPPDTTAPQLTQLTIAPKLVKRARGAVLGFTLSEPARVSGTVARRLPGVRTKGGRCLKRTAKRHGPVCILRTAAGSFFAPNGAAGPNRATLGVKDLPAGDYTLTLTPIDAAGNSGKPKAIQFRVDL